MTRSKVICPAVLAVLGATVGCAQVAGIESHEPMPASDAGPDVAEVGTDSPDVVEPADASDAGTDADATDATAEDSSPNPWTDAPETCNFADDDHDGTSDDGFEWSVGEWKLVWTGTSVRRADAVRTTEGNVAVAILDGEDPKTTARAVLFGLGNDAEVVTGPIDVMTGQAIDGFGIAAAEGNEVGVGILAIPQDGCDAGCPVAVSRYAGPTLASAGGIELTHSALQTTVVPVMRLMDLGWTTAGYVALAVDTDGYGRLVWENPSGIHLAGAWNGLLPETKPYAGSLAVGPAIAYGAYRDSLTGQQEAVVGIASLGAYTRILKPTVAFAGGGGNTIPALAGRKSAVWSGSDVMLMVGIESPQGIRSARLYLVHVDGTLDQLQGIYAEAYSLSGGDSVILATALSATGLEVHRVSNAGAGAGAAIAVDDAAELSIAAGTGAPVLVRVSADRTKVWAAVMECE